MKTLLTLTRAASLTLAISFLTGCASVQDARHSGPKFQDAASVDAVLQFSTWDYTFLVEPRYEEDGGFLSRLPVEAMNDVFDQMHVQRGTAAVVIGWFYEGETLEKAITEWKSVLTGCGFQRVVILRPNFGNPERLNGSVIIDDYTTAITAVRTPSRS